MAFSPMKTLPHVLSGIPVNRRIALGGRELGFELLFFGAAGKGVGGGLTGRDDGGDLVEVAGADEALVAYRAVALVGDGELALLDAVRVGQHALFFVGFGELEHGEVERVEAGEGDELELVTHAAKLVLEGGDLGLGELLTPVEGGRAVVGKELAGELRVDGRGEILGRGDAGLGGLAPDDIGVRSVGEAPGDGAVDPSADAIEAFDAALAGGEAIVGRVAVAGEFAHGPSAPWIESETCLW